MKNVLLLGTLLLCVVSASSRLFAETITFENLPDAYFFSSGGQNIGTYYAGLDFGPDVTALSVSRFGGYGNTAFPPHSGDVVIWSAFDPDLEVSFSALQDSVGIWYTSFDPLTLSAYDSSGNLLGTVVGNPNTDGTTGTTDFISFSGAGIASVDFSSSPSLFTLDDLTYQPQAASPVPEPSSLMLLAMTGMLSLGAYLTRRKWGRQAHARQ